MGRVLVILGILAFAAVSVAVASYFLLVRPGLDLDASSRAYVDSSVRAIVSNWDAKELQARASDEFLKATPEEQILKLFQAFRKLGDLKDYQGAKGQAGVFITPQTGKVVSAQYVADANFQNGKAQIQIYLLKNRGEWKIAGFRINSPLFLDQMAR